jgi:2-dehydro-3-deoxygluconokinase
VLARIVEHVDVLVGKEDLQKGLGMPGPQVAATSKPDPSAFFGMMERVASRFPNMKIVATTLRGALHQQTCVGAVAWVRGDVRVADLRARRARSRGRRRRVRVRFFYGLLSGNAGRSRAPRLGARRAADDVPG